MNKTQFAALAMLGAAVWLGAQSKDCPDGKCPPKVPAKPEPKPKVPDKPKPKPKPWRSEGRGPVGSPFGASIGGPVHEGGTEIRCDLPHEHHTRNTSSWGLGNCVWTSIGHSAEWQNVDAFRGFAKWLTAKGIPGGGYPQKVDELAPRIAADRGLPVPDYLNITSADPTLLKLACAGGRMPAVTYSRSPTGRYNGGHISHMVSLPHASNDLYCVLDNNYPGAQAYEWMSEGEFLRTCNEGQPYWCVVLLSPPPPPPPKNLTARKR